MRKLLVGTTNKGKFSEIKAFLADLPFQIICLNDLSEKFSEPKEEETTLEGNAELKARYYGEKTGLLTIADDSGMYIKILKGWPGIVSARIGNDDKERRRIILEKMKGKINRKALFVAVLSVYDPKDKITFSVRGETIGEILSKEIEGKNCFGYDPIFYVTKKGKTYSEMERAEKNGCSHRGKALIKIKYFLQKQYGPRNLIAPLAIIIKDGKMLATKRNDPHQPNFHHRWEFPGGLIEMGEGIEECLKREAKEETGYIIEPILKLPEVYVHFEKKYNYQVFLFAYLCKIKSGKFQISDEETAGHGWFTLEESLKLNWLPLNKKIIHKNLELLKKYIK